MKGGVDMTRLDADDAVATESAVDCAGPRTLLIETREVPLGGVRAMSVHRSLPQRDLPLVGAWCFLDPRRDLLRGLQGSVRSFLRVRWIPMRSLSIYAQPASTIPCEGQTIGSLSMFVPKEPPTSGLGPTRRTCCCC